MSVGKIKQAGGENPLRLMAQETGLKHEFRLSAGMHPPVNFEGFDYKLEENRTDPLEPIPREEIAIPKIIIDIMQDVSSSQVAGMGTLVRLPHEITAFVSLAEAAIWSLNDVYCDLLWILLQSIERFLRSYKSMSENFVICYSCKRQKATPFNVTYAQAQEFLDLSDEGSDDSNGVVEKVDHPSFKKPATQGIETLRTRAASTGKLSQKSPQKQYYSFTDQLQANRKLHEEITSTLPLPWARSQYRSSPPEHHKDVDENTNMRMESTNLRRTRQYIALRKLLLRKVTDRWMLDLPTPFAEAIAFKYLLQWLAVCLGDPGSVEEVTLGWYKISELQSIDLGQENRHKHKQHCWRAKVIEGNILNLSHQSLPTKIHLDWLEALIVSTPGSLILTAAALWSLFDNLLVRIAGCTCTFTTKRGDFLQCRSSQANRFVWHYFTGGDLCDGSICHENVQIALTDQEPGERIFTNSFCILDWFAKSRVGPTDVVWEDLAVTAKFKAKPLVTYSVKDVQLLAQLSVPAILSPQFGGAVTFARKRYVVRNSNIDKAQLSLAKAASTIVLIYDEQRELHLTLNGADIIEMCCVEQLRRIGYVISTVPDFGHTSAMRRMVAWSTWTFITPLGTAIPGECLVNDAVTYIIRLKQEAEDANRTGKLLYWLLEDILLDRPSQALKAPRSEHVTWHRLARAATPLIFAIGNIDREFLTCTGYNPTWVHANDNRKSLLKKMKTHLNISDVRGGVVGSKETVKHWMSQSQLLLDLKLIPMRDKMQYGSEATDIESTYAIRGDSISGDQGFRCSCVCKEPAVCVHYIQ